MEIVLKSKNISGFVRALREIRKTLVGEINGEAWVYKTDKGTYTFYDSTVGNGFVRFEGKRRSFGTSSFFRVRRIKRAIGKDKIKMSIGTEEFEMKVTHFESSASDKPFWVNCSKDEYRALQKLKAY